MPATSRWVVFDPNAQTPISAKTAHVVSGTGTLGYIEGQSTASGIITIVKDDSDQFQVKVDSLGDWQCITLASGTDLDARTVANDITFKLKGLIGDQFDNVHCEYINNKFRIYSSSLGTNSRVEVASGPNNCLHLLGMASSQTASPATTALNGSAPANNQTYSGAGGQLTVSGQYFGQFDETYVITVGATQPVGEADQTLAAGYAGICSTGGWYDNATACTYTITVNNTAGNVMNSANGSVPTMTWVADGIVDSSAQPVEILYSDYWYNIGTQGLRIKFSDAPFTENNAVIKVICTPPTKITASDSQGFGAVGTAQYHWGSLSHGKSTMPLTTQTTLQHLHKGIRVAWANGTLYAKDQFRVLASGPQPTTLGATLLNFGSVTVSTYSPVIPVWFELISGARTLKNVKFGLQSRGTAQHHMQGEYGTKFAFGTVGAANNGSTEIGYEWYSGMDPSVSLADGNNVAPEQLSAIKNNLAVVSSAAASEAIGVKAGGMVTDFIFLSILLSASEVGSNSSILYRAFYDYTP